MAKAKNARKIPIALQLYSIRHECKKDLKGTLAAVAKMGYDGVEFAGYYDTPAADLRKMLDDFGLKAAGTHIGINALLGDELKKTVEFNKAIGNSFLIVPGLPPERTKTAEDWAQTAALAEDLAVQLGPQGLWVGFHNHSAEMADFAGRRAWDILYGSTKKVVMQMDTGNALHAGVEPLAFMKKYPGRHQSVHMKEHSAAKGWVPLGEGDVDFQGVVSFCKSSGDTRWFVIEFENEAYPVMETVAKCLEFLRGITG
ncbi:MAG: sugar phosphate isomerase/epimerase family protein [Phycisphaerae bacterium]